MTDAEIIRKSVRSPEHFASVFDRHHAAIHAFAARRVGTDIADDILSEVFLAAFSSRNRFDSDIGDVRAWLYGIAANVVRRRWRTVINQERLARSVARSVEHTASLSVYDPDGGDDAAGRWEVVRALLSEMAEGDREAILLFAWEELTYDEIAEVLGIPIGTVRSRIHRVRVALREGLVNNELKETHR